MVENFNDPFDIFPNYQIDNEQVGYIEELAGVNPTGLSSSDIKQLAFLHDRKHGNSYGITCFSKTPKDILMWAHYGDKHKGISLEFKVRQPLEKFFFGIYPNIKQPYQSKLIEIKYEEDRPVFRFSKEPIVARKQIEDILKTKSKVWENEDEVRIMVRPGGENIEKDTFPRNIFYRTRVLTKIFLGAKMSFESYTDFFSFYKHQGLKCHIEIMQLAENLYILNSKAINKKCANILYKNIIYARDNIPKQNVIRAAYYIYGEKSDKNKLDITKFKYYWRSIINKITMHEMEYFPFFLSGEFTELIYNVPNSNKNTVEISCFLDYMLQAIEVEKNKDREFLSD
ncbi:Protein of unknown function [Propionispira arboris]|uniref:DUF2971 domain-containing protein n=1 Tax=Propionispira arboris TaxID=84035 RepID=A0A1H7A8A3_9FIRM|nr:DUF2971 domain-containing protein [Propionispira arboris]SEJ60117.1 Protein of unknown function [Propionispira arboris]